MDPGWQEAQEAFQARVLTDADPALGLRPYRTFRGDAHAPGQERTSRGERLLLIIVTGSVIVALLLAFAAPREVAALTASVLGGVALLTAVSPTPGRGPAVESAPLLAVYAPTVVRGAAPVCVTRISDDEFLRLGAEGFGTVVGDPRPGATFGLFVDDHLVWPRTPPRSAKAGDPRFGDA